MDFRISKLFGILFLMEISADPLCRTHLGAKLCYDHCSRLKGCTLYRFTSDHLVCCFGNDTVSPPEISRSVVISIKQGDLMETPSWCQSMDRMIETHSNSITCVSDGRARKKKKTFVGTRLLLVQKHEISEKTFYHIRLKNRVLKKHKYAPLKVPRVADLKYNHKSKIVYLAYYGDLDCEIHKFHFRNKSTSLYYMPGSFETMALDVERDWILFCTRPSDGVYKLHEGKQTLLFKTRVLDIKSMAVCSRKQLIYASTYDTVIMFSYTGAEDLFYRISAETPLLMDFTDRYLYFNTQDMPHSCILQTDTETNKTTCLVKRKGKSTEALAIDSKRMYIKDSYSDLVVYNIASKHLERSLYFDDNPYLMCLVDF